MSLAKTIRESLANNFVSAHDVTTQAISVADTFQDVTFATDDAIDGWTHGSGADFICNRTGKYEVILDLHYEKTGGGAETFGWRALFNAVEVPDSAGGVDIAISNSIQKISKPMIVDAVSSQILKFEIAGSATTVQIAQGPNPGSATINPSASVKIERIT